MDGYPDIQRRDGTLFFSIAERDRTAIATSVERLIDLLDAMDGDPDIEANGDELDTGMPETWRVSQRFDYSSGFTRLDVLEDDEEDHDNEEGADDEPWLGWCGNATGWQAGEPEDEADDEREPNGDEGDYSGTEDDSLISLDFDGSGQAIASGMLRDRFEDLPKDIR
jgi:hypothetical protein